MRVKNFIFDVGNQIINLTPASIITFLLTTDEAASKRAKESENGRNIIEIK